MVEYLNVLQRAYCNKFFVLLKQLLLLHNCCLGTFVQCNWPIYIFNRPKEGHGIEITSDAAINNSETSLKDTNWSKKFSNKSLNFETRLNRHIINISTWQYITSWPNQTLTHNPNQIYSLGPDETLQYSIYYD